VTLAQDPGRPSKPTLIARILRAEIRSARRKLGLRLSYRSLRDALPEEWSVPDSDHAKKAEKAAKAICQDFIFAHCHRTYCFGALLAARDGIKLDREVLFIASILHDLGLSEKHKDDPGSFEWVGARLAHKFCIDEGVLEERAELIHNAIALHSSVGIADKLTPEIATLHLGAGVDLFGTRIDEVPTGALSQILKKYPRDEFKACIGGCLQHQARTKPGSYFAAPAALGINKRIVEDLQN